MWISCKECTGDEGESADWPCETARLLYEDDEILQLLEPLRAQQAAERAEAIARKAKRQAEIAAGSPLTMGEQVAAIYAPMIQAQLKPINWGSFKR